MPADHDPAHANSKLARLGAAERRVMEYLLDQRRVTRDVNRELEENRRLGERVADRIAAFGGSWTFILLFLLVLVGWVVRVLDRGRPVAGTVRDWAAAAWSAEPTTRTTAAASSVPACVARLPSRVTTAGREGSEEGEYEDGAKKWMS